MEDRIIIRNIKTNKSTIQTVFDEDVINSEFQGDKTILDFSFGFFRISHLGDLVYSNNAFCKIIGYGSNKEISGKMIIDDDFAKNFSFQKYSQLLKNTTGIAFLTSKWVKKNGESILLKEHVQSVKDNNGEVIYFDIIVEDVTEFEFSRRLINDIKVGDYSIFKALPDIIFVVSSEGTLKEFKTNHNNIFSKYNILLGKSVFSLFSPLTAGLFKTAIKNTIQSGELQSFEFQLGDISLPQFFEARLALASNEHILIVLRDITEQKQSEFKIKKFSEELEQINKIKDKFFSIVGHDLRTPINGLLGYSEILANEIDILGKEEIREYASSIMDISRTTNNLLSNLLEWSRIQTGRITFQPSAINLFSFVNTIFNFLHPAASQKNISLLNNVALSTIINADENMLQSIFMNLCGNAIKFTNNGGIVKIHCNDEENNLLIMVEDNGQGISKLNMKNLLKENSYFSTSGTAKEKGTGLGLILCKEFIEKHSGRLWAESSEGQGTIFYFTIPKIIS